MSKIESRDFWVSDKMTLGHLTVRSNGTLSITSVNSEKTSEYPHRLTVSWEAPEKVVTISESDLIDPLNVQFRMCDGKRYYLLDELREKLFKDKV